MTKEQLEAFLKNIRTPLNMILEYARQIAETDNGETRRLYAGIIETNSTLLQQLLKTLDNEQPSDPAPAPAASVQAVSQPAPVPPPAPAEPKKEMIRKEPGDRPTLLIAEDNENNYLLLQALLEDNYQLLHAWDGVEAVELFKEHQPRLILMDISMPRMDGYEATKEIRKVSDSVPIIAVTAYAFASDRERIMEIGFNSYISKPIDSIKLENEILRFL